MRFNKVLLINPNYHGNYSATLIAGLGYLAEALHDIGVDYRVVDMELGYTQNDVIKIIREYQPDLIGLSMMTFRYRNTIKLIEEVKRICNVRVVVGGPFVSTFRNKALTDCPAIDFGVVLEGEETLSELCRGKEIAEIKGLIHRQGPTVVYNGNRPYIEDLDRISFPRYYGFELAKYPSNAISIVSSRGCPYNCIYCPVNLVVGRQMRFRSAKSIIDEIKYWYNLKYRRFAFADDNFTLMPQRVNDICDQIEGEGLVGLQLILGNGIRADKVDERLLSRMKKVGFYHIGLGVESGSQKVLNRMKKAETLAQIERAIELCCRLNFEVKLHFVLGTPSETLEDVRMSVALALKYPVAEVSFNNLIPYPGTELYDWVARNKCFLIEPDNYLNDISPAIRAPVFITPEASQSERLLFFRLADEAERAVRRKFYERKMRFGLLGRFAAKAISQKHLFNLLITNRRLKMMALKLKALVMR